MQDPAPHGEASSGHSEQQGNKQQKKGGHPAGQGDCFNQTQEIKEGRIEEILKVSSQIEENQDHRNHEEEEGEPPKKEDDPVGAGRMLHEEKNIICG